MKKYTVKLDPDTDIQKVIAWCEESFGKQVSIPLHNRKNWWDKRASERSDSKKRWQYKSLLALVYSVKQSNGPVYYYETVEVITHHLFSFLNETDYFAFKNRISWYPVFVFVEDSHGVHTIILAGDQNGETPS